MAQKLSIILTTLNNHDNLSKTLESIELQTYPEIEVIIKDGGSTDGTIDIIQEYEKKSRFEVKWIVSKDHGIYEAMNQGYELATGDIILFFNDQFSYPDAIKEMMELLDKNPDSVGVHADLVYANEEKVVRYWRMGKQRSFVWGWMPGHPTLFLRREVYEKYGLYDTSYRISADYEFMIRFLKDKENHLEYLPKTVVRMYYGGTSTSGLKSYYKSFMEGYHALKKNHVKGAFLITVFRTCRVIMQFFRGA